MQNRASSAPWIGRNYFIALWVAMMGVSMWEMIVIDQLPVIAAAIGVVGLGAAWLLGET